MVNIKCPVDLCTWESGEIPDTVVLQFLQMHEKDKHPATPPPAPTITTTPTPHARVEKVRRPTISAAGTGEDWTYFLARWEEYTAATGVTGRDRTLQLLECCDDDLRKDLTRNAGCSLAGSPEQSVLASIKVLAVREENILVAQNELWNMQQNHSEAIRSFAARLRGQASMCNFSMVCGEENCEHVNNYSEPIVRGALLRGLADYDIKLAVLQDKNQQMSLEQALQLIEAKEAGKRSANKLQDSHEVAAARRLSEYRRSAKTSANTNKPPTPTDDKQGSKPDNAPCTYCGKVGHGAKAKPNVRMNKCPAYNTKCTYCSLPHHLESFCRKKTQQEQITGADNLAASSLHAYDGHDQLCVLEQVTDTSAETPTPPFETQDTIIAAPSVVSQQPITELLEQARQLIEELQHERTKFIAPPNIEEISEEASATMLHTDAVETSAAKSIDDVPPTGITSIDESSTDKTPPIASTTCLDHHVYDSVAKAWVKKRSQPQPFLKLDISVHPEDYADLNLPAIFPAVKSGTLHVMADTGCQCFKLLRQLRTSPHPRKHANGNCYSRHGRYHGLHPLTAGG